MSGSRALGVTGRISMKILAVGLSVLLTFPAVGHPKLQEGSYAFAGGSFYLRDEYVAEVDAGRGYGLKLGFGYRFNQSIGLELMFDRVPAAEPEDFAYAHTSWNRARGYVLNSFNVETTGARCSSLAAVFELPLNDLGKSSFLAKVGLGVISVDWSGTFEMEHPERGRELVIEDEADMTWPLLVAAAGAKFPMDAKGENEVQILATKYMDIGGYNSVSLGVSFLHNF